MSVKDEYYKIRHEKERKVWDEISSMGCVDLEHDISTLDGEYTSIDLRLIADAMDELSAIRANMSSK